MVYGETILTYPYEPIILPVTTYINNQSNLV